MTALVDLTSPTLATATDLEHEPPGDAAWWWRDARGESQPDGDHRWQPMESGGLDLRVRSPWSGTYSWGATAVDGKQSQFAALPSDDRLALELADDELGTFRQVLHVRPASAPARIEIPDVIRAGTPLDDLVLLVPDAARLTVDEAVEVTAGHLRGVLLGAGWRCEPVPWRVR